MARRILLVVENLSVPFDRRVWQEASALREAGYDVDVISPQGATTDREPEARIDGVAIHRYPLDEATGGALDYVREYGIALRQTLRLARRLAADRPFDALHACNPPDLLFGVALALRRQGTRFVFDHHDLVPELYLSREETPRPAVHRGLLALERLTFAAADLVLSTNDSYRHVAIDRGRMAPERVHVVRSAPDLARFRRGRPDDTLRRGRRHLLLYLGVMGPQDGVDHALHALDHLRRRLGRHDVHTAFVGAGPAFERCVDLAHRLQLDDVEFTGRVSDEVLARYLATADLGLAPDPLNPLNDVSSMNKVVEYLALGVPVVAFDLKETRVSAGDAGAYAPPNDDEVFARCIDRLLADPERRARMAIEGKRRVAEELSWDVSKRNLLTAYESLWGSVGVASPVRTPAGVG